MRDKPSCRNCRFIWRKKSGTPPCDTCREEILEEDEDVVRVYQAVKNHVIREDGVIYDVNIQAVESAMNIYKVVDRIDCYERVSKIFRILIKER